MLQVLQAALFAPAQVSPLLPPLFGSSILPLHKRVQGQLNHHPSGPAGNFLRPSQGKPSTATSMTSLAQCLPMPWEITR